jgi:splicing factor 3A subunit 1
MKLTAQFTARRGHSFLAALSVREGRNYQFDFLRPNHSLFGCFNGLVEQYTRVLQPNADTLAKLKERTREGEKWKTLELSRRYAKWERTKREKEKKRQDDQEAERSACHPHSHNPIANASQLPSPRLTGTIMPLYRLLTSPWLMPTPSYQLP